MGNNKESRNRNRQGGWSKRKDGRLDVYVTVDTPYGPRECRTTKRTEDEADEWITTTKYEARRGSFLSFDASTLTVGEFIERWLEDSVHGTVREITYLGYASTFRAHIAETIGTVRLSRLTPAHVQAWKRQRIKKGTKPNMMGKSMQLLKRALRQAAAWEMIARNPAEYVKPPRYTPKETAYVRLQDFWRYLGAVKGDPYEALFVVAGTGGPRTAELIALRWDDWDEENGEVMIDEGVSILPGGIEDFNAPKTKAGRRRIPLTTVANTALKEHHTRFLEARMKTGERGDYSKSLIFPSPKDPRRVYSRWQLLNRWYRRLDDADLPRVTMHALRHTATMLMAKAKADPKTVQGILGHADIVTTLRVYTHFVQEDAVRTARDLDRLLELPSGGPPRKT